MAKSSFNPREIVVDPKQKTYLQLAAAIVAGLFIVYVVYSGLYSVKEFEKAVILRFGKYIDTTGPGLHFKLPLIDQRVLVDCSEHSVRLPWGTAERNVRGELKVDRRSEEGSLILTGDLYAAVVEWNLVWRVVDPADYLFNINEDQINEAIMSVSRSTMHRIVGDYSADEILTGKRSEIARLAREEMSEQLDALGCGVEIVDMQLQRVTPPDRVKPSFDRVNESIQEKDRLVNDANKERNRLIPEAKAKQDKLVREAEGYASRRKAEATGEISALLAKFEAYQQAPEITKKRLYLESMERVLEESGPKLILDDGLSNLLPVLPIGEGSGPAPFTKSTANQ